MGEGSPGSGPRGVRGGPVGAAGGRNAVRGNVGARGGGPGDLERVVSKKWQ